MRIGVISFHCCPFSPVGGDGVGGMNVYLKELSRALSLFPGTEVDIFTRVQDIKRNRINPFGSSVRVIHLPAGPACPVDRRYLFDFLPEFAHRLREYIRGARIAYDLIYSHYWLSGLVGEYIKSCLGIPQVHTYHTLAFLKNRVSSGPENKHRMPAEQHLSRVSDLIISSSFEEKRSLIDEYGIPASKVEVIYPGVNPELFSPYPNRASFRDSGFSEEGKILLYVGRVEPVKGLMTVIDALGRLHQAQDPLGLRLRLMVIGGGEKGLELSQNNEVRRIKDAVEEKGLKEKVVFLGSQKQDVLREFYSAADALVVPSLYESFGLVVIESLACGTPVLVSHVGKMKTIVKEGKNGFSFPPSDPDALASVIKEFFHKKDGLWPGEQIRRDIVEKFSWERTGRETLRALTDLRDRKLSATRKFRPDEIPQLV